MKARHILLGLLSTILLLTPDGRAWASNWTNALSAGSSAQTRAQSLPAAPTGTTATCATTTSSKITVTWSRVANASSYKVWDSTTSATGGYSVVASGLNTTSWTSGSLSSGNYWFEVSASIGSNWPSANSPATGETTVVFKSSCVQP